MSFRCLSRRTHYDGGPHSVARSLSDHAVASRHRRPQRNEWRRFRSWLVRASAKNPVSLRRTTRPGLTRTSCRSMPRCARECFLRMFARRRERPHRAPHATPFPLDEQTCLMHNGQIGGYHTIRRRLEALIPDKLYNDRIGTTDTEALFLIALANGLEQDPVRAMAKTMGLARAKWIVPASARRCALPPHLPMAKGSGRFAGQAIWSQRRWIRRPKPTQLLFRSPSMSSARTGWRRHPITSSSPGTETLALYCRSIPRGRRRTLALRRGAGGYSQSRPCVDGSRTRTRERPSIWS